MSLTARCLEHSRKIPRLAACIAHPAYSQCQKAQVRRISRVRKVRITVNAQTPFESVRCYSDDASRTPGAVYVDEADMEDGDAVGESLQDGGEGSSSSDTRDSKLEVDLKPEPYFAEHLNGVFRPLEFPPELARRVLTHASHPAARFGHNGGLGFLGRRVLNSYLHLFLHSSPALEDSHDLEDIASRTLNAYVLGEQAGTRWGLGRVLRWTPTVRKNKLKMGVDQTALLRSVGLYKVQGDAVAAVMGGIFHQFGASIAHRVFHTRLLPHILLGRKPEGLPHVFHVDALKACQRFGGLEGSLLVTSHGSMKTPTQPSHNLLP